MINIVSKPKEKNCNGCIFNDTNCYELKLARIVKELLGQCNEKKIIYVIKK